MGLFGIMGCFPGENKVDSVLREDSDQGQYRNRERFGNVYLSGFGRPGQQESRSKYGNSKKQSPANR